MLLLVLPLALFVTNQASQPAEPDRLPPARAALTLLPMEKFESLEEHFTEELKAALPAERGVAFHSNAALNHLFLAATGQATPAEYNVPAHVSEEVISDIAAWLRRPV